MLDGEMAVLCNLQSALAGFNSHKRYSNVRSSSYESVLMSDTHAMVARELRQVRKEATVSGNYHVL